MSSRSRSNHSQCHINFSTCGCTLVGVPKPNPEGSNECAITRCQGLLSESYRDVRSLGWGVLLREREPARWKKMTSTRVSNQDGAWGKGGFHTGQVRLSSEAGGTATGLQVSSIAGYISARLKTAGMGDSLLSWHLKTRRKSRIFPSARTALLNCTNGGASIYRGSKADGNGSSRRPQVFAARNDSSPLRELNYWCDVTVVAAKLPYACLRPNGPPSVALS
jgi:hypothetical protein